MINLSRTCKPLATLFKRAVETKWRINTHLRRFVRDPFKFREALGKCDGLIAGGFALQFFDRVYWPEAEMRVFITKGRDQPLVKHLTEHEGYKLVQQRELLGLVPLKQEWEPDEAMVSKEVNIQPSFS
ncbi:hypothetical protein MBLNU230_g4058t1 [Neophaeotheca triangularis]